MAILDDLLGGMLGGPRDPQGQPIGGGRAQQGPGGGMRGIMTALLPVVLSMLASRGGRAAQPGLRESGGLGDILGQVLVGREGAGGMGGLGALLEQVQRTGYGDQARSWVSTGQNMPISAEVIGQIFGGGGVEEIAHRAGVTPQEATTGLSELLPEVVDYVTPNGQVPDLDQLTASVDSLRQRMGV